MLAALAWASGMITYRTRKARMITNLVSHFRLSSFIFDFSPYGHRPSVHLSTFIFQLPFTIDKVLEPKEEAFALYMCGLAYTTEEMP